MSEKRCACGRFEIPSDAMPGQVADGVLHLDASATPDTCEIARLRAERDALAASLKEAEAFVERLRVEGKRADDHGLEVDGGWLAEECVAFLASGAQGNGKDGTR